MTASPAVLPCSDWHETFCGDGGRATDARLLYPTGIATVPGGGFLVADSGNAAVRRVLPQGTITTVAGLGTPGFSGDHGPAVAAQLKGPTDVSSAAGSKVLIADAGNDVIRQVSADGVITTVAGVAPGSSSSGFLPSTTARSAKSVRLVDPLGVTAVAGGNYLVADTGANMVLQVSPGGLLRVVAGTGQPGYSGDGGPATSARLSSPTRVIPISDGGFLILDLGNGVVRKVSPAGTIATIPGKTWTTDTFGQSVPPDRNPGGLAQDAHGNIFVISGRQVERISPTGGEAPIAGTPECGSGGDKGPPLVATFAVPSGLAVTATGNVLVSDIQNSNVRQAIAGTSISTVAGSPSDGHDQAPCIAAGGGPNGALWPIFYITAPRSARPFHAITIQFLTTRPALVSTMLVKKGARVRSVRRPATAGANSVTLAPGVPSGMYTMRITATADLDNNWPDQGGTLQVPKTYQAVLRVG
jgi:hypothetical protein